MAGPRLAKPSRESSKSEAPPDAWDPEARCPRDLELEAPLVPARLEPDCKAKSQEVQSRSYFKCKEKTYKQHLSYRAMPNIGRIMHTQVQTVGMLKREKLRVQPHLTHANQATTIQAYFIICLDKYWDFKCSQDQTEHSQV